MPLTVATIPLRFESVRQGALLFERLGYSITRDPQVSALNLTPQPIVAGGLVVNPTRRTVELNGCPLELKAREFDLLSVLARHPAQVFTRAQLLDLIWPCDFEGSDRTVDVHISRLRRKLGNPRPALVVTVPGVGYKLAVPRANRVAMRIV